MRKWRGDRKEARERKKDIDWSPDDVKERRKWKEGKEGSRIEEIYLSESNTVTIRTWFIRHTSVCMWYCCQSMMINPQFSFSNEVTIINKDITFTFKCNLISSKLWIQTVSCNNRFPLKPPRNHQNSLSDWEAHFPLCTNSNDKRTQACMVIRWQWLLILTNCSMSRC